MTAIPTKLKLQAEELPLDYESSGDQAGSDAKPGVGTRCSL